MMTNYYFSKKTVISLATFLLAFIPVDSFSFQLDKSPVNYDVLFKESIKRSGKILNLSGKKIGDEGIERLIASQYLKKVNSFSSIRIILRKTGFKLIIKY